MISVELLKSLRSLVSYHQSCGIDHYPSTEMLESGLALIDTMATGSAAYGEPSDALPEAKKQPSGQSPPAMEADRSDRVTIDELAVEIQKCRICPLHKARKTSTAGRGGIQPDLLIVGDWLVHDNGRPGDEIFGQQQDLMLSNMIAAIDLKFSAVFITNVIKCSVDAGFKPDSTHIGACLSYLKQQISILSPKIICTMGAATSQALLNSSLPLIRLRGRFHQLQSGKEKTIPLMPTFHPSYLLNNPEMKKPTWEDLQAIKKKLKQ